MLAFFCWLDCLVVQDCLFLGTYGSYHETPFSVAAAVIHMSVLGWARGGETLKICVCFVLWKHTHF